MTPASAPFLLLDATDDVAVAMGDLCAGQTCTLPQGPVTLAGDIPRGHKFAVTARAAGEPVTKYGHVIGVASQPIAVGEHVHSHNLAYVGDSGAVEIATDPGQLPAKPVGRTFEGYLRADGRVGTRNFIGILTSVNCSATTATMIAEQVRPLLAQYPHVDGIVPLTHGSGCGMVPNSYGGQVMQRTLRGYASHPNFGAILAVGLGCEMLQLDALIAGAEIPEDTLVEQLRIQDSGGIRATVRAGVAAIERMLPQLEERRRTPQPLSQLVLGLNCGGSDGYSGITANPALGVASDLIVAAGGRSVLAEIPEIFGAEELLTRRAVDERVGHRVLERLAWWHDYAADGEGTLDNNPSPGNKAGGLTTILEKSLGAVAKAGHAPLSDVVEYAQPITTPGLNLMDTPGYDPVSVTGLIAGGANVVVFTTGRGSVIGSRPTPLIKVCTNTETFNRMVDDMDINAGRIADGTVTVDELGVEIFEEILRVASGHKTVSEELGIGQHEFVPWQIGAVT